jgi:hypothetical protein
MRPLIFRDPQYSEGPLPTALRKLEKWLTERRWILAWSYSDDDNVDFNRRLITINSNRTPQSQIFGIIHEIGHILLYESPDYVVRFANSDEFKNRREKSRETLKVRAESLGEEWEAWALGETLARRMALEIDYQSYYKARNRDLKSYAKWLVE